MAGAYWAEENEMSMPMPVDEVGLVGDLGRLYASVETETVSYYHEKPMGIDGAVVVAIDTFGVGNETPWE